ncbi:bi-domain-containing oxidoreductase [Desulfonatronospira sp.]|uniref:bi-domain-containing oxidoreductase n=1 Tax=Desulfonatronospira sp. TaxID=1962951 RepID=UPI0025C4AF5F|nr:bi-domain-containing oxidoreductase [Desulfonatronospira sp.]
MKQLTQQLKSGKMEILEVPFPALNTGHILVRNHYSVISAGTEGKTVTDARKGYIAKARSRQKEVRQVIEMIKAKGFLPTYKLVMNKLEAPSPLGYSCAGEVIAIGQGVTKFKVGDYVACGAAPHADVVSVPVNLAVPVPKHVDLKQASFATIAAVAIQGIRQAEIQMGSNCLIIGMGLIGQLTYLILETSGMHPIGMDVSDDQLELCRAAGIEKVYLRNQAGIEDIVLQHSKGYGTDAVIITAGSSSLDPVEFAGSVARQKARVVVVGAVPTGFSRANYYKKELDLRMSCSYGPGRYDPEYEEKGIDYPIGQVRWTENRNMQSFVDLLSANKLNIDKLITHTFTLENAPEAYDLILSRKEPFAGMLIQYDEQADLQKTIRLKEFSSTPEEVNVGFVGAGSFAQGTLLPGMKGLCNFVGVSTARGNTSRYVADKSGFSYCAEKADDLFLDTNINTIFVVTRHNLHAESVLKSIEHGKNVFVEKPLAMNEAELAEIRSLYEKKTAQGTQKHLIVGFNRRFAPPVVELQKKFLPEQPKSILIRVNSGVMPADHWVNDPEIGGGRIIGEACHFIDLAMHLAGSPIVSVSAEALSDADNLNNTVVVNLKMKNGSTASVNYFSNGNKQMSKEYLEIFCAGKVAVINDFKELILYEDKIKKIKYKQDKGHKACVQAFLKAIKDGGTTPIPFEELWLSTLATFKVNQSILENRKILIEEQI